MWAELSSLFNVLCVAHIFCPVYNKKIKKIIKKTFGHFSQIYQQEVFFSFLCQRSEGTRETSVEV